MTFSLYVMATLVLRCDDFSLSAEQPPLGASQCRRSTECPQAFAVPLPLKVLANTSINSE
jgi:hypothetical protein